MIYSKTAPWILLILLGVEGIAHAARPDWCARHLAQRAGKTVEEPKPKLASKAAATEEVKPQLETVDDMLWAFSNGLIPDPKNPAQLSAFEVYLKMRFGDSKNALGGDATSLGAVIDQIAKELKKHPELSKIPFRNFEMSTAERSYPVTDKLQVLIKTPVEAAGQARGNLFQIEANLGYWKRLLNWEEAKAPENLTKDQKKEYAKTEKERFLKFVDSVITGNLRSKLADPKSTLSLEEKAKHLFQNLKAQREKFIAEGKDTHQIARAMVDLVHTIGFHNKEIQADLKTRKPFKNAFLKLSKM
jgi:hypothetical protein